MILINNPLSVETTLNASGNLTSLNDFIEFTNTQATRGHRSQAGDENFEDFTNMFKGAERPGLDEFENARLVVEKVKLEHNPNRLNDVIIWCEREAYFAELDECVSDISD